MKKNLKRVGIFVLSMSMLLGQGIPILAEENGVQEQRVEAAALAAEEGYQVTFVTDEHVTVDVFYGKDYTGNPDAVNVKNTEARTNAQIDTSGNGQVNFRVNVEDGYELVSVTADANYKNLKGASDTGVEGIYRLTKITGNVTVTIKVQEQKQTVGSREDIVLNEIESNGDTTDWIEIYNKGTLPVDISGWYVTDDDTSRLRKNKTTSLPEGTFLNPGEYLVFEKNTDFTFGLGAPDEVNLFDTTGTLVEKYSWSSHAQGVYARVPDGTGNFIDTAVSTKGAANHTADIVKPTYPNAVAWPGSDTVITYDDGISMFKSDSSGLDFYKGQLYCINNKNGTFWVMDVNKDGTMDYADGFTAAGKNLAFLADASNPAASNPDAEGITVDDAGNAYAAVERDNNNKNVNHNVILKFNPWEDKSVVVASKEWNITNVLPDVLANAGIEAVEWVPNSALEGKLFDRNTGDVYHASTYLNAAENGVFFVALENNGHVYALALNEDGSSQIIADIDPGIGGAMALDYDSYEGVLWVGADDGYGNVSAKIAFNGTDSPAITLVNPPAGMDVTRNNEGFAIAEPEYTVNGLRPVYHFMDGVNSGVLTISYMYCDYQDKKPETEQNDYKFLEGENGSWTQNSDGTLRFRANGEFSKFTEVKVDGVLVSTDNYTAEAGSTIITFKSSFLKSLSAGTHKITVVYTDGECSANFEVKQAAEGTTADTTSNATTEATSEATTATTTAAVSDATATASKEAATTATVTKAPKTGDDSNPLVWIVLLVAACGGMAGCAAYGKHKH